MTNEIKEILDYFTKYKDDWYSAEYRLKPKQCVMLYDYITNLQEEIKRQEKSQIILDNQNADLKEENITLREQIRTYYRPENELNKHKYEILQERIDKAINFINNKGTRIYKEDIKWSNEWLLYFENKYKNELLQILQGEDK